MKIIKDTIAALTEADEFLDKLGPLDEATDKAAAELDATETALAKTKKALADATSGLTMAQLKNLRDYEETIFAKNQEVKAIEEKIAETKTRSETASAIVDALQLKHDQLEASLTSLRKQHFG